MKKTFVVLALPLILSACAISNPFEENPLIEEEQEVTENQVIENQETENKYEATVDYLDTPEVWSAVEVVEANRAYYIGIAPESDYSEPEDYPETVKSSLQVWKTGVFKTTEYEGQSLVLVNYCDGMCINTPYSRYAVDEESDTWTLLSNYSSESSIIPGPADEVDETLEIPEFETPETLSFYETDDLILTQAFARLNPFYFDNDSSTEGYEKIENPADDSYQTYYFYRTPGCVYAVFPDGMMARYMEVPSIYEVEPNSYEPIMKDMTFMGKDGTNVSKSYSLSAGGCGLAWSCLDSFELTSAEEASLGEVGTLDGRPVYLPTEMEERPETNADYDLTQRLYNAYDNYLMRLTYSEDEETELSMEDYLADGNLFLVKLDSGVYLLTYNSEYAPSVECGKPVIYLYPEQSTLVNVQVGIDEFTKTIPAYGEKGWTVLAKANGMLTNLADGLKYPYLFWEGQSYESQMMGETWTLPVTAVGEELPTALAEMGFTAQESADFMEFWLPHLEAVGTPHVEFAFVDESVMNQIAPLFIKPIPDQVIRVFMYYRGVGSEGHERPSFQSIARHGFTVFEWGGSLY